MTESTRQPGDYEHLAEFYFTKINKDLHFSENKIGLICLIVRCDESGCVDMASNLNDKNTMNALKHILRTMTEQKRAE